MVYNGFVVLEKISEVNGVKYHGVENAPFPLSDKEIETFFSPKQINQFEDLTIFPEDGVSLLNLELVQPYIAYCHEMRYNYRLLYCEICENARPIDSELRQKFAKEESFLGYDIGQCCFDFYSCLLTDIIYRPALFDNRHNKKLNPNGLFANIEDAMIFLNDRCALIKQHPSQFEKGNMRVIALYSVEKL